MTKEYPSIAVLSNFGAHSVPLHLMKCDIDVPFVGEHTMVTSLHFDQMWVFVLTIAHWGGGNEIWWRQNDDDDDDDDEDEDNNDDEIMDLVANLSIAYQSANWLKITYLSLTYKTYSHSPYSSICSLQHQ